MATKVEATKRKFIYNGKTLNDIEALSPSEVQDFYSREFPELLNAKLIDKGINKNIRVYEFTVANGVKG